MSENEQNQLNVQDEQLQEQEPQDAQDVENTDEQEEESPRKPSAKERKAAKQAKREERQEDARLYKEWRDSIVANKRVKREENRRKLKRAMLIMLVFALVVTSIVYIMLLFVSENNVRITATPKDPDKAITLSLDNEHWTPYLNAQGPETLWDISYNKAYGREPLKTIDEVRAMLNPANIPDNPLGDGGEGEEPSLTPTGFILGEQNGKDYICFTFMLKNEGQSDATINYEMTLEYDDDHDLHEAVRVMWGESFRNDTTGEKTDVTVYAALSDNPRLANTSINLNNGMTQETGYLEYVAYPQGSYNPGERYYDLSVYENEVYGSNDIIAAETAGYIACAPFANEQFVYQRETTLEMGDIMYCYVCIWLEGSDFDCNDSAIGGYVKMGINFIAS